MSLQINVPVEVITRILSFMLASPSDDPRRLPTARPHPISVLLVCKGLTRAVLPHFYRYIHVFKSRDWYTLFNPEYGVLGLDEKDTPEDERRFPLLTVRQSWVRELFLGLTANGSPVEYPFDVAGARESFVDWDDRWEAKMNADGELEDDDSDGVLCTLPVWLLDLCLLPYCTPDLPRLDTIVVVPLVRPNVETDLYRVLKSYNLQVRAHESGSIGEDLPAVLWDELQSRVEIIGATLQEEWFDRLDLLSGVKTVHLPGDYTFLEYSQFCAFRNIYSRAHDAELVVYLNLDGLHDPEDPDPLYDRSPLQAFVELLDGEQRGYIDDKPGTPANKNVLLIGDRDEMIHVVDYEWAEEICCRRAWRWLAPDGKRRHPMASLSWEGEGEVGSESEDDEDGGEDEEEDEDGSEEDQGEEGAEE